MSNPLQPNPPHPMVNIVFCVKLIFLIHPHNTVVLHVSAAQCARVTHIMLGKKRSPSKYKFISSIVVLVLFTVYLLLHQIHRSLINQQEYL